jgi:PAS domain S-box-containing protein
MIKKVHKLFKAQTNYKKAEKALKESERKLNSILKTVPDVIYRLDKEGKITFMSESIKRYGYTPYEVLGENIFSFIHPDDREKSLYRINEKRTGIRKTQSFEVRFIKKNGNLEMNRLKPEMLSNSSVFLIAAEGLYSSEIPATNAFIGTQGIARDITERKSAEEKILYQASLIQCVSDAIISSDMNSVIQSWNKAACNIYGYAADEVIGVKIDEVLKTDYPIVSKRRISNEFARYGHWKGEIIQRRKDGTTLNIFTSVAIINDKIGNPTGIVYVNRDITSMRKLEVEINKARNLESIGLLAGGIAHDFNNILTAVMGNISIAKIYATEGDEIFNIMDKAEKATTRATELTQQLLTFSKGGAPIKKKTSISDLLRETAEFSLHGSKSKCVFDISENLWAVEIDRGQISQVMNNLIINADQAMPYGGYIDVTAENIVIDEEHDREKYYPHIKIGKYVKISIQDHGVGIRKKDLHKIFDPYFTTKKEGSGLGLTTTYSIVNRHDGYIDVDSDIGSGTTFSVYLPCSGSEIEKECVSFRKSKPLFKGQGKVLLMDDEKVVKDIANLMMSGLGYMVDTVDDGIELIELYKKAKECGEPYNVVIMDLTIPGGMGGRETIKKLLEYDQKAKAVVSSGYSNDPIMAKYKKYGFHDVLMKPYNVEEIAKLLHKLIPLH